MGQSELIVTLADERATAALAASLFLPLRDVAERLPAGALVNLEGPLGAGKTSFVRGLLREAGVTGPIRSPTYTLIEPYSIAGLDVHHIDLYRLTGEAALPGIGLEELRRAKSLALVEWPERLPGVLGPPTLTVTLSYAGRGRAATLRAHDAAGRAVLAGRQPPEAT